MVLPWIASLSAVIAIFTVELALLHPLRLVLEGAAGWLTDLASASLLSAIIVPMVFWTTRAWVDNGGARSVRALGPGDAPHRRIARMLVAGSLLKLGCVLAIFLLLQRSTSIDVDLARQINSLESQRMGAQQIGLLAWRTAHVRDVAAQLAAAASLENHCASWRRNHSALMDRVLGPLPESVSAVMQDATPAVRGLCLEAERLIKTVEQFGGESPEAWAAMRAVVANVEDYRPRMSLAINLLQANAESEHHAAVNAAWLGTALVAIAVVGVGASVAVPAITTVKQQWLVLGEHAEQSERLATLARRTDNAVVVSDEFGRIEWINDGFTRITGYTLAEAKGNTPGALLKGPKTDRETSRRIREAIAAGRGFQEEILNYSKSRKPYWIAIDCQPIYNAAGRLTGFMAIEKDISERREHEERLGSLLAQLEEAQSVARLGSWSYDLQTGEIRWSRQIYSLFGRDEALGPPDYAGMLSDYQDADAERLDAAVKHALATGEPYTIVLQTRRGHNGVRFIRGEGRTRKDASGAIVAISGTAMDVTAQIEHEHALREAQAKAEAANASKSEFLANMSHEIRTPMTAILGFADLLAEDGDLSKAPPSRLEHINTIKRHGVHLLSVINDILDISKIEAGKMSVERVPTNAATIIHDVISLMAVRAQSKNLRLTADFKSLLPAEMPSDPTRLRQIILNLVGNAIKFTETGSVTVEAELRPCDDGRGMLVVSVRDTGIGITPRQAERLFDAFEQADGSTTRRYGGTGLGLRISKRLAHMLGGDVVVRSEPDKGSTFTLTVDAGELATLRMVDANAVSQHRHADAVGRPAPAADQRLSGMRILVAEDAPDNQRLIAFHLKKAGAILTIVDNGRKAIEALTRGSISDPLISPCPFDFVLMDMQMPEMDGYSAARRLRQLGCALPILALTAHAMAGDREKCLTAGCTGYATKPIDRDALISAIAELARPPVRAAA